MQRHPGATEPSQILDMNSPGIDFHPLRLRSGLNRSLLRSHRPKRGISSEETPVSLCTRVFWQDEHGHWRWNGIGTTPIVVTRRNTTSLWRAICPEQVDTA
jgi:hypothetical protein